MESIEPNDFSLSLIKSFIFKFTIIILVFIGILQISIYFTLISNLLGKFIFNFKKDDNEDKSSVFFCDATTTTNYKDIESPQSLENIIAATALVSVQEDASSSSSCNSSMVLLKENKRENKRKRENCCGRCCAYLRYS
jgi:hypothetical protein